MRRMYKASKKARLMQPARISKPVLEMGVVGLCMVDNGMGRVEGYKYAGKGG